MKPLLKRDLDRLWKTRGDRWPVLYCRECHSTWSADPGDYFTLTLWEPVKCGAQHADESGYVQSCDGQLVIGERVSSTVPWADAPKVRRLITNVWRAFNRKFPQ